LEDNFSQIFIDVLRLVYEMAVEQLKRWKIDRQFLRKYGRSTGAGRVSPRHVVACEKP
jgi:hypothetical protein